MYVPCSGPHQLPRLAGVHAAAVLLLQDLRGRAADRGPEHPARGRRGGVARRVPADVRADLAARPPPPPRLQPRLLQVRGDHYTIRR